MNKLIPFSSIAELWEYLINEGTVIHIDSKKIYYLKGLILFRKQVSDNDTQVSSLSDGYYKYAPYEEPKWYECIPECGVLCWVWDDGTKTCKRTEIICKVIDGNYRFVNRIGLKWKNAEPLTREEVEKLIYKGN